jgi:glycolate oxidase FAD binding subunit
VTAVLATNDKLLAEFAAEVGTTGPVVIEGSRTRWDVGGAPSANARVLVAPSGIVDYVPAEMTVRVRAGTTVTDLHTQVAEHGQRTALPERGGTVGGAVAVGQNHLTVLGRGTLRSSVLQVRYVSAEGRLITGGGPTVKNVTGFDLPRLMTGSLGTLGCLAEFIIRTNPIPAVSRWLAADGVDPFAVHRAVLAPAAVLWDRQRTWVLLEGHGPDIEAESEAVCATGPFAEVAGPPDLPPHRWSVRPGDLATLDSEATGAVCASVGVGAVFASKPQPPRPVSAAVAEVSRRVKAQYDPSDRLNPGRRIGDF